MSKEAVITNTETITQTIPAIMVTTPSTEFNISETPSYTEEFFNVSSTESTLNTSAVTQYFQNESPATLTVFEAFIIIEIVMTALELVISVVAAIKMPRWRRNYRNQMLMHLSVARFIKRVIFLLQFLEDQQTQHSQGCALLKSAQIYIDFVIVILIFFFIKHMYDSLIIVLVKISQNNLNRILICAWLLPVPISAVWTAVLVTEVLSEWTVYLCISCVFRWPLMFIGTSLYITTLYRVLSEKMRKFARSLTIVTFLMCLVTNFYLLSKDVIELWCMKTAFATRLASYVSGFLMNMFILCFYVIIIILSFNHNAQSSRSFRDKNIPDAK